MHGAFLVPYPQDAPVELGVLCIYRTEEARSLKRYLESMKMTGPKSQYITKALDTG